MRILITGSAGFIGSNLSERLINLGHTVTGIDSMNNYYKFEIKDKRNKLLTEYKNFSFLEKDIIDINQIDEDFDLVIHLAAQAGVRLNYENYDQYISSNIVGFKSVFDFCLKRKISKLIYASSSSVYGDRNGYLSETDTDLNPVSLYGITKKFNEDYSRIYGKKNKIDTVGLRFFTVYGPNGRPDMAYYKFTKNILEGNTVTLFNDGNLSRDMTHIDDIADGLQKTIDYIMSKSNINEVFNLGNNEPIKTNELLQMIENAIGIKAKIQKQELKTEVRSTHACLKKSRAQLGYVPKIDLHEGVKQFVRWYKSENK